MQDKLIEKIQQQKKFLFWENYHPQILLILLIN